MKSASGFLGALLHRRGQEAVRRATAHAAEQHHTWVLMCFNGVQAEPYSIHPFAYTEADQATRIAHDWVAKRVSDVHGMDYCTAFEACYVQSHRGNYIVGDDLGEFHVMIVPVITEVRR